MIGAYLRTCAKVGLAMFFVMHCIAVATYSIPTDASDTPSRWVVTHVVSRVRPYILVTGQWQQWNLFAPNPLRRIIFYRLEQENADGSWAAIATIDDSTYSFWRHSVRFKLYGSAIPERGEKPELAERAAQVLCREYDLEPGAHVRLWHNVSIIPYIKASADPSWWMSWTPQSEPSLAADTVCDA